MSRDRPAGDLTQGPLLLRLVTFGVPLVLGMFFHSLFNLVDLIIVGKLGPWALAAVNQASIPNFIPMLLSNGVSTASIAVISRNFGMRNYKRANANTLQGFLLLAGMAVALGWPSYVYALELNQLVGSTGQALLPATEYLEISSAGLFTMFALMQVTAVLRAGGNARWPMFLLVGANVLNVGLTIALVFGWWIFPEMGVAGAAWGTVIARGLFALLGLYVITRRGSPVRLDLRRIRIRPRMMSQLVRLGIPSSMQFVVRVVVWGAILRFVNVFGEAEEVHAALAVGLRLDMLALFTGAGWGAAGAAMVGQCLGAGMPERARRAGLYATVLGLITMVGIGILFWVFARWLMVVFGEDPSVKPEFASAVAFGVEYLRIAVFAYPFVAIGITLAQCLNGAGSTKTPLALDTFGYLMVQIPAVAYIASRHAEWPRTYLWWSIVATAALVAVFYVLVWHRGHWMKKKLR
ncbi:MAG: MATE family efflux transporter [Planctomycetota bacterium]|nr:MATE family efflux transporter [Planctomycetota bacterium]